MSRTILKERILHALLYVTFCFSVLVSSECPSPGSNPIVKYTGDHIKISDVVACASVNRGKSLVVIQSFNTTKMDANYRNFQESFNAIQPSLLIITPIWDRRENINYFYLNGNNGGPAEAKPSGQGRRIGKPGNPGGTAGSFMLIYKNYADGAASGRSSIEGGNGGNGQEGQDGRDGRDGTAKKPIQHDDEHCSAWEDGWTRVWLAPHKCHDETDKDGRCFAGSTGARWEIFGNEGERGEDGNDGGAAGIGGKGGHYLVANVGRGLNTSIGAGTVGKNGAGGNAGKPGKGGNVGDSIIVTMGVDETPQGKKCGFLRGPINKPVEHFAKDGNPASNGANTVGQRQPMEPFALADFRPHIQSYLIDCVYEATEQGNAKLMTFCDDVKSYFSL